MWSSTPWPRPRSDAPLPPEAAAAAARPRSAPTRERAPRDRTRRPARAAGRGPSPNRRLRSHRVSRRMTTPLSTSRCARLFELPPPWRRPSPIGYSPRRAPTVHIAAPPSERASSTGPAPARCAAPSPTAIRSRSRWHSSRCTTHRAPAWSSSPGPSLPHAGARPCPAATSTTGRTDAGPSSVNSGKRPASTPRAATYGSRTP